MIDEELQLVWLPTFDGKEGDFCAWDGANLIGRVFYSRYGSWHWHLRKRNSVEQSGRAPSELGAKLTLELKWFKDY